MKITDALESVLRLLVTTDRHPAEPGAGRPLLDWARRSNERGAGPWPAEPAVVATQSLAPVDHDVAHLEAAAHVAESLNLGFHLGSAVERIASAAAQGSQGVPSLREAVWLIERYIAIIEKRP